MRGILFDLDGVLYNGDEPIAGAAEAVEWVRGHQIPHLFVTNTTSVRGTFDPNTEIAHLLNLPNGAVENVGAGLGELMAVLP